VISNLQNSKETRIKFRIKIPTTNKPSKFGAYKKLQFVVAHIFGKSSPPYPSSIVHELCTCLAISKDVHS
jgi:hypothetical protein